MWLNAAVKGDSTEAEPGSPRGAALAREIQAGHAEASAVSGAEAVQKAMRRLRTVLTTPSPLDRYQASGTRRSVEGDVVLLEAGPQDARRRHVIVLGPVAPEALFARARAFYGGERVDGVELAAEYAMAVEAELVRRGWRVTEEEPALVMEGAPAALPAAPPELTVRRVGDEAGLEDFFAVSRGGRRWVPSAEAACDPRVAVLVGYLDGEAVATARVSGHGAVADIMGVETRPEHRRRGYGTAMTWAAVGAARGMGCGAFLLTATEMGFPVYVRMGFSQVCTLRTYEPIEANA
jgi:ribosomal protein S18 acetylase RimI-like enzyme